MGRYEKSTILAYFHLLRTLVLPLTYYAGVEQEAPPPRKKQAATLSTPHFYYARHLPVRSLMQSDGVTLNEEYSIAWLYIRDTYVNVVC